MTLRARLLLASGLILGVCVLGAGALLKTQESFLVGQVDDELRSSRPFLRIPPPNLDNGATPIRAPEPDDTPISDLYFGIVEDGQITTVLQGRLLDDVPDLNVDQASLESIANGEAFNVDGRSSSTRFRVAVVQPAGLDAPAVVALPLDEVDTTIGRLRWALAGGVAVIAVVLAVAMWWVERLGLRPVARVTAAADAIARGGREHRVDVASTRTEAGKLASAFNVMLDERDASEQRLRQFVEDASHELRTPLTSIRGYLDLYREGGFRLDGELDDIVRRMSQESRRMNDLVEDLLLLAQLDQHRPLRRQSVNVGALLGDVADDAQILQPDRRIFVDIAEPVETIGDAFQLQQVVGALVSNALVHTDVEAELRLGARTTVDGTEITIADTGPGLTASDAARVFDRFFRGDQSRDRRTGGSGLGLAIAKSIVEAHCGTISLDTAPWHGCRFVIRLPSGGSPAEAGRFIDEHSSSSERHDRSHGGQPERSVGCWG